MPGEMSTQRRPNIRDAHVSMPFALYRRCKADMLQDGTSYIQKMSEASGQELADGGLYACVAC
jgi:hypothetical protein